MNIYVGNLAYEVSEDKLRELFAQYGPVTAVRIVTDSGSGRSKGFGFVEMETREAGQAAIEALNETEFSGRLMRVNEARPREEGGNRPPRRGGGGNPRRSGPAGGRPGGGEDRW